MHMNKNSVQCKDKNNFEGNNQFYHDDLKIKYYSCASFNLVNNCLECTNKATCEKCFEGYDLNNDKILYASKVDKENSMYSYNSLGIIMIYDDLIPGCNQCFNDSSCFNCNDGSVLLENDICLSKNVLEEKHNYFIDEKTKSILVVPS